MDSELGHILVKFIMQPTDFAAEERIVLRIALRLRRQEIDRQSIDL